MKVFDCEQGTPEWMACRLGLATASRFADVLATIKTGEASVRRNYRAQLVVERLTGRPVPTYANFAMQQGTEREPVARALYEAKTGRLVQEVGFCRHDEMEAGASPDGLIDEDGGLEVKCPQLATHLEYLRLRTEPHEYTPQIQGCMWITGRQWWDFVSFNPDFPETLQLVVRRVKRDDAYIERLATAVKTFMVEVCADEAEVRALPEAA